MGVMEGVLAIIGVCVVVLLLVLCRKRVDIVVNFILRGLVGVVLIYLINDVLLFQKIPATVGINLISVSISGMFGLPGVALLYGITSCGLL